MYQTSPPTELEVLRSQHGLFIDLKLSRDSAVTPGFLKGFSENLKLKSATFVLNTGCPKNGLSHDRVVLF